MAMPELKTFRGSSMTDVLFKVKKDLGPSAVIVSTRSFRTGAVMGVGGKPVVEIVASLPEQHVTSRNSSRGPQARAYDDVPRRRTPVRVEAGAVSASAEGVGTVAAPAISQGHVRSQMATTIGGDALPARPASRGPARLMPLPVSPDPQNPEAVDQLRDELGSIKQMVSQLLRVSTQSSARVSRERFGIAEAPMFENGSLPEPLFAHYTRLLDAGVDVPTSQTVIASVRDLLEGDGENDARKVRSAVLAELARRIPCEPLPEPDGDGPQVIALIGPTGVGKTTTIAKLAADHALRRQRRVVLITSDTYRIGAVDQLRAYAQIIGIQMHVAATPEEMATAVAKCSDADVILIDTAGRSPSDHQRLDEFGPILEAARPTHRVLVLSAAASDTAIERTAKKFADLRPDRVILTKLDEAVTMGVCINAPRLASVPVAYVTTGQDVPDFIVGAAPESLSIAILDGELPR
jgi:flagellar biosynthesis protein FlhF